MNKVREGIQRKIRDIEGKKAEIEGERDKLKDENNQLQNRKCYIFNKITDWCHKCIDIKNKYLHACLLPYEDLHTVVAV